MSFPLDLSRIQEVEQTLGRKLPASYVAHMQSSNGGNTPDDRWILHPIFDTKNRNRIKRTANHILRETEKARQIPGFPTGALVIGENMESSLLLLLPASAAPDRFDSAVYSWHPFHGDLDKLVEDFAEFPAGW